MVVVIYNIDWGRYDSDYEMQDDVSSDKAWGYCDQKCHVSVSNLEAKDLQEVKIPFFSVT